MGRRGHTGGADLRIIKTGRECQPYPYYQAFCCEVGHSHMINSVKKSSAALLNGTDAFQLRRIHIALVHHFSVS